PTGGTWKSLPHAHRQRPPHRDNPHQRRWRSDLAEIRRADGGVGLPSQRRLRFLESSAGFVRRGRRRGAIPQPGLSRADIGTARPPGHLGGAGRLRPFLFWPRPARLPEKGGRMRILLAACLTVLALPVAGAEPARPPITAVSHLAVYASDAAKAEAFYVHDLGAVKLPDPENPAGVRYYFSPTQFVEVLPLPAGSGINRLDHAAFTVANAEAMRRYLISKGIAAPGSVTQGSDGSRWFQVKDPEGATVEFVQQPARLPKVADGGLSTHIIHVGFIIHDRQAEDRFYRDVLGFRPYWAGGMK